MATVAAGGEPMQERHAYRRGVLLVLLAGVCWSLMGVGIRSMEAATSWQILFYRSLSLAAFLMLVLALRSGGRPFAVIRDAGWSGVLGGLALVGAFAGGIIAIKLTSVANAMFLFAASPFFAALLGRAILGETVRAGTWKAMAIAGLGVGVMVANGIGLGYAGGNAMAIFSALCFALFAVALRRGRAADMMPAVFLAGVFAAIAGALGCVQTGEGFAVSTPDLAIALALGVVQIGLGMVFCTLGARSIPATEVALISLSEVLLAPLWVWLLVDETPTLLTLLGGVVLMAALVVNATTGMRRRPAPIGLR